ncbi:hypothetical protein, partial [Corynebacterium ulcerans]|uniref:hypothetical protein n=1 Tax=Corynebacterium ulcerans TaxID=65058 RepID=UPI000C77DB0D
MSDVVLHVDGGEITVGRQMGTFVWGRWDVTLPSEVKLKTEADNRMAEGFIYRPDGLPTGRFDLRGVRADSSQVMAVDKSGEIDYKLSTSDTEQVLDAAEKRIEGNVFFERDITVSGLGIHVPGVDFQEDDLVDVALWGKRLPDQPVTAIDIVSKRGSVEKYRVHVGGRAIADMEALRAHREKVYAQIAANQREEASKLATVGAKVEKIGSTAAQADENAKAAQGSADQAQETADEAIKKWRQQKDELDALQTRQIKELDAQNAALRRLGDLQE